jgi:indolepyruvate ferredoxin oxidoreductase alpha subunit
VCGEVSHAAILCPSFYRADLIYNPNVWDKFKAKLRTKIIGMLQARADKKRAQYSFGEG